MNPRLFVLGMLAREPMHGYQIRKALADSRTDTGLSIGPRNHIFGCARQSRPLTRYCGRIRRPVMSP